MSEKTDVTKASMETQKFALSELGYNGLRVSSGQIYEEIKRELQFPQSITTYKQMTYDSAISSALSYYENMMLKTKFSVKPHPDADETHKEYANFFQECLDDMEHSWQDFVQEVSSFNTYGFCVNEIVLRKRLESKGSKFNDGKIGIRKLPIRSQDSIYKWNYDDDQKLVGLTQVVAKTGKRGQVLMSSKGEEITIDRNKFLLFRLGKKKDSPVGESPLRACYYPWKYKTAVEELESVGLDRDLSGVPIAWIPLQIMSQDADAATKEQYNMWKNIVRNIQQNQQSGLVLPLQYDETTKQPIYKFELLKNEGGKAYDTTSIKDYYVKAILTAMSADFLIIGQGSTGSYALGSIKGTLSAIAIESKVKEICNVINQHLIPLLGKMNGWDLTKLPFLDIDDLEAVSLEDVSKFLQRTGSIGMLPKTPAVVNRILNLLGLDSLPEGTNLDDVLTDNTSKSGQELDNPLDGSRRTPVSGNSNDNNLDNAG
jgi:phage gp29-like protein